MNTNKKMVIGISAVLVLIIAAVLVIVVVNSKEDDTSSINSNDITQNINKESLETYNHNQAINSAVSSGNATSETSNLTIGMTVEEVNNTLGVTGEMKSEYDGLVMYEYPALNENRLQVIFEENKLVAIALVQ